MSDDAEMKRAERDDTFGQWAGWLGLTKPALLNLIRSTAP